MISIYSYKDLLFVAMEIIVNLVLCIRVSQLVVHGLLLNLR